MIIVIGGGVAGLNAALALRRRTSLPISLLEAGRIAEQGASSVPYALLNVHRGRSALASPADLEGLDAMMALRPELGLGEEIDLGLRDRGITRVATSASQQERWQTLDNVRVFGPSQEKSSPTTPHGGFHTTRGGWVDTRVHLLALRRYLESRGVDVRERTSVHSIEGTEPPYRLITSDGELRAERIISATGATHVSWLPPSHFRRVAGLSIALSSAKEDPTLERPLIGKAYLIPERDGYHIGGIHLPDTSNTTEDIGLYARELQHHASRMVPRLEARKIASTWRGVRAVGFGHQPEVTSIGPGFWHFGNFAGRGYLTATAHAKKLVDQVLPDARSDST